MSRQPRRQLDSPRKLTTRPASTPITTINRGHCRSDLAAALVSGRCTSHQVFGPFHDVAEQHRSGHRPDTAWHGRHPTGNLAYARIKITHQPGLSTGDADVDADGSRFDHVGGEEPWPSRGSNDDVSLSSVPEQLYGPGVAQCDGRVLALPRQQQSQRPADRGTSSDDADFRTVEPDAVTAEQFDDATRSAWQRARRSQHQLAEVDRMQAVGILLRIDQCERSVVIQAAGQWQLDDIAGAGRVGVQLGDYRGKL